MGKVEEGVKVKGPVKDHLQALRKYRALLAPLRFGAGVKGKIADSWFVGLPVVTTPIGAEGMSDELEWGGLVASNVDSFVEESCRMYQDHELWERCRSNGYRLMKKLFDRNTNFEDVLMKVNRIVEELPQRRKEDVVSSLLWSEGMLASEWMAKWITAQKTIKELEKKIIDLETEKSTNFLNESN
eukprot:TRINITY_DN1278_c0_g1_i4.p1 TRINITY_DN1278_c0_g1~~TRINITY_DN1278_c0_g1_i4.p1  ORF type:complete len:185 (+),score=43.92 TRINITY_DN1278_c0_g1_i4:841-1395(+)